jgi:hypothetical protein
LFDLVELVDYVDMSSGRIDAHGAIVAVDHISNLELSKVAGCYNKVGWQLMLGFGVLCGVGFCGP